VCRCVAKKEVWGWLRTVLRRRVLSPVLRSVYLPALFSGGGAGTLNQLGRVLCAQMESLTHKAVEFFRRVHFQGNMPDFPGWTMHICGFCACEDWVSRNDIVAVKNQKDLRGKFV
jgi:hypothetical protein